MIQAPKTRKTKKITNPELVLLLRCLSNRNVEDVRVSLNEIHPQNRRDVLKRTARILLRSDLVHETEIRVGGTKLLRALSHRESRTVANLRKSNRELRQLIRRYKKQGLVATRRLARQICNILRTSEWAADADVRIGGITLLIALLPETMPQIEKLLSDRSRPLSYEVHFSLFVFANQEIIPRALRLGFLLLTEKYIRGLRKDAGNIAWKAGEFLGDHWSNAESVDILLRCARSAKYSAGKQAALCGLLYAHSRVDINKKKVIAATLQKAQQSGSDKEVKSIAAFVLSNIQSQRAPKLPNVRPRKQ